MASIYFHIPFCRKACSYCDFYFTTSGTHREDFVDALLAEMRLRKDFFGEPVELESLYFGGGTPSLLTAKEVDRILNETAKYFSLKNVKEVTLEANPDDLHLAHLQDFRAAGINRLSIGIQSFVERDLRLMNRAHNAGQAKKCVPMAREAGFEKITVDLIYGIPGQSDAEWEANVQQVIDWEVPHVSAYALTVEPKTRLAHEVKTGKVVLPEDEGYRAQFLRLTEMLSGAGFRHYELSNYALPGGESVHNSAYWAGKPYLGLGPSAHSFVGRERSWNVASLPKYVRGLQANILPAGEREVLEDKDLLNEYVMTGLRTAKGVNASRFLQEWNYDWPVENGEKLLEYEKVGWLIRENGWIRLTEAGFFVSDYIIGELFWV